VSLMPGSHDERVREAFTRQAGTFEDERLNVAFTAGLPWLLAHVEPRPDDVALDVAAGTGLVARALAGQVAHVTAVDSTAAMITQGRRRALEEGHANLRFVSGSAERLPLPDGSFSLVVTRFSLHHFADPSPAVAEMVRVLRPGGRLVVKDLVASTDPEVAVRQDHVERLRDPSHVRMPPRGGVAAWMRDRGLEVTAVAEREIDRPVEAWLEQALTEAGAAAQVREAFAGELAGGEPTGMRPHLADDGEVWFHQCWEVTVARRP
jgi:ubiquinone/menaquinone biosynthesis C-methylase UbiE